MCGTLLHNGRETKEQGTKKMCKPLWGTKKKQAQTQRRVTTTKKSTLAQSANILLVFRFAFN